MPDYKEIYRRHADQYELLTSREDPDGNLIRAINGIRPLAGLDVVELGAGTGRITRLMAPLANHIYAFDESLSMLRVAVTKLPAAGWSAAAADHRALPLPADVADLVVAGWTLAHFVGWYPDRWREEIGRALAQVARVLRPGGTAILIDTLGTGQTSPSPPTEELATYYAWLETDLGYHATWVRTDFYFHSRAEAEGLLDFFFGDPFQDQLDDRDDHVHLPECTGLWWRTF